MKPYTDQEFKRVIDECAAEVEEMLRRTKVTKSVTLDERGGWLRRIAAVLF